MSALLLAVRGEGQRLAGSDGHLATHARHRGELSALRHCGERVGHGQHGALTQGAARALVLGGHAPALGRGGQADGELLARQRLEQPTERLVHSTTALFEEDAGARAGAHDQHVNVVARVVRHDAVVQHPQAGALRQANGPDGVDVGAAQAVAEAGVARALAHAHGLTQGTVEAGEGEE
ncbi:MAG: hypothetical protein IPG81_01525 [Sandaracinaceae bacterium]|nr:hypothetical protein [Sandaracinaceae bacterium]